MEDWRRKEGKEKGGREGWRRKGGKIGGGREGKEEER